MCVGGGVYQLRNIHNKLSMLSYCVLLNKLKENNNDAINH